MAEPRDFQCHFHAIGFIGDKSIPSDHIPVRLVIECPRKKQLDHLVIRRGLTHHSFLSLLCIKSTVKWCTMVTPSSRLISSRSLRSVHVLSEAQLSILTKHHNYPRAKLLIACSAVRANRNGLSAPVEQCCNSWDRVARCFVWQCVECVTVRALCNIVEGAKGDVRACEEEFNSLDVNQVEKDIKLSKCASSQQSWAVNKSQAHHPCNLG